MDSSEPLSLKRRRQRDRVIWRGGLAVSLVLHVAVFLFWRGDLIPVPSTSAAGPEQGDARAAAGAMQALNIRASPETPVVPPPVPIAVEATVEIVDFEDEPQVDPADLLGDQPGLEELPGVEAGTGGGDRGDAESGVDSMQPPSPQGLIIPTRNPDLSGTEVQVWVFVDQSGRVVADSTRLDPPTRDRDFNRRLIREASEWVFRPATRDGSPVSAWFPYLIIM